VLGPPNATDTSPLISSDGSTIIFLSGTANSQQLFFIRPDGSGRRSLTNASDGITSAAISGDGRIAYAVTGSNALLKIDTQNGSIQQIVSPMPQVSVFGGGAPGSLITLSGKTLASTTVVGTAPYPTKLGGITATIDEVPSPLLSVSPTQVMFQIPWETRVDPTPPPLPFPRVEPLASSVVLPGGDPYFDVSFPLPLAQIAPQLSPLAPSADGYQPIAVHQNGTLVTPANPAARGEIVTLYGTGFGPVEPPLASGIPAPLDTLGRATTTFEFDLYRDLRVVYPMATSFLGLAPGTLGIYQINLQIPSSIPADTYLLGWKTTDSPTPTNLGQVPVM
jgi:uncharacterized protein (TIGR03437 family)